MIRQAYPIVHACGDALSGALMNAGPIIHPPLILMNAAPLQHFERWDIHNEGTQPSVRAVTDRLDLERIAVREALGYQAPHFPLTDHYTSDRWMYGDAHKRLVDSGDWREHIDLHTHRYMTEDTVLGLAFLASVARWAGVDAPLAQRLAGGRRRRSSAATCARARARSKRSASPAFRARRSCSDRLITDARVSAARTHDRRRRRRPHGPRHRARVRLRRPPRSPWST